MSKPLSWCILTINTTNYTQSAEIFEVGILGSDGKTFSTKARPQGYVSSETGYTSDELPEKKLDTAGITKSLARYDVVISHNAFFTATKIERYLPTKAQRKEEGSSLPANIFACSLYQLDWSDRKCKKLICLDADTHAKEEFKTALGRCKILLKTLGKAKVQELLATAFKEYTIITPTGYMVAEDFAMLKDHGFTKHGSIYVKYLETKDAIRPNLPFKVNGSIIGRDKLFIRPGREVTR